jgi:hypothetical protein
MISPPNKALNGGSSAYGGSTDQRGKPRNDGHS